MVLPITRKYAQSLCDKFNKVPKRYATRSLPPSLYLSIRNKMRTRKSRRIFKVRRHKKCYQLNVGRLGCCCCCCLCYCFTVASKSVWHLCWRRQLPRPKHLQHLRPAAAIEKERANTTTRAHS